MDITELLKKYVVIQSLYDKGILTADIIPLFETITAVIGSGDLFPVIKLHYIDGLTMEAIAELLGYEIRTVYRRQKSELEELASIINGNWINLLPSPIEL